MPRKKSNTRRRITNTTGGTRPKKEPLPKREKPDAQRTELHDLKPPGFWR